MSDRIAELKELIAGVELSDPFAQVDHARWQAELKRLIGAGAEGGFTRRSKTSRRPALSQRGPRPQGPTSPPRPPAMQRSQSIAARPVPVPAAPALIPPEPNPGSLLWCRTLWVPTLRWCQKQLNDIPQDKTTKKSGAHNSRRYIRGEFEIFAALIQSALNAKNAAEFHRAQMIAVRYRKKHVHLREAPIPNPIPTVHKTARPCVERRPHSAVKATENPIRSVPVRSAGGFPAGESLASYNRLRMTDRGRSFEDSVALRQSSKQARRLVVDITDRISSSGSAEDYEDLD